MGPILVPKQWTHIAGPKKKQITQHRNKSQNTMGPLLVPGSHKLEATYLDNPHKYNYIGPIAGPSALFCCL